MSIQKLFNLRTPGYGCNAASATYTGLDLDLAYTYEDDNGDEWQGFIKFKSCASFRFSDESYTNNYPSEAFDAVAEHVNSNWIKSFKTEKDQPSERKHYVVYLRNHGLYEVLAESVIEEESIKINDK